MNKNEIAAELHIENMNKSIIDQSEKYTEWDYHEDGDIFVFFTADKDCEGKVYDAKYLISMYKSETPLVYCDDIQNLYNNYDIETCQQIVDLLYEFDANPITGNFNEFLKNRGYK